MPSYPCKHGTCTNLVPGRPGYCPDHAQDAARDRRERDRFYDRHQRDPEARAFYASAAWQRARRIKLAANPVCQRCQRTWARHVHHKTPLARCTPAQRLDQSNLMSLCPPCHNEVEAEAEKGRAA